MDADTVLGTPAAFFLYEMTKEIRGAEGQVYDLERELLGSGGIAFVYPAVVRATQEKVAIKEVAKRPGARQELALREGRILARLQQGHDNIVRLLEILDWPSRILFVMERLQRSLDSMGKLDAAACRAYLPQILKGLHFLHVEAGLIHRDLKPSNIMLAEDGTVKLVDFGLAQATQPTSSLNSCHGLGTPYFLPPEAGMREPSPSYDIWSLGITLFVLLTGLPPRPYRHASTTVEMCLCVSKVTLGQISTEELLPSPEECPNVPELMDLLRLCLKKDPEHRPSCEELLRQPFLQTLPAARPPELVQPRAAEMPPQWRVVFERNGNSIKSFEDLSLGKEVGRGSSSVVRKVLHRMTKKVFAMKSEILEHDNGPVNDSVMNLTHENVINCFVVFRDGPSLHLVMEYMNVGSLREMLDVLTSRLFRPEDAKGVVPEPVLSCITRQLLSGLKYLHDSNIVHRDLKPSNILIKRSGSVKIADYGSFKELLYSDESNTIIGSECFMSPERIRGEPYGRAADVWSLGLVVAYCALGWYPFVPPGQELLATVSVCIMIRGGTAVVDFDAAARMCAADPGLVEPFPASETLKQFVCGR
eukprot:RCo034655